MALPFDLVGEAGSADPQKQGLSGSSSGKRLTNKCGSSLEFADYRPYLPGDDIRRIDWSVWPQPPPLYPPQSRRVGRHGEYRGGWQRLHGLGEHSKGYHSLGLALALGYISIQAYDRVTLAVGTKDVDSFLPPVHGRAALPRLIQFLEGQHFGHAGDLSTLLLSLGRLLRPQQLTAVISDFLSPWQRGLESLLSARQEVLAFHVISPDELEPDWRGAITLVDSETGAKKDVDLDQFTLAAYREGVGQHVAEIHDFCRSRGIAYFQYSPADNPVDFLAGIAPAILKPV